MELEKEVLEKNHLDFLPREDDVFRYQGLLCFSDVEELMQQILSEAHNSQFSIHLGVTTIYHV